MENTSGISVIIQFLNSARHLSQAIESVCRQTFSGWELILVDGGSHDQSVAIAESYRQRYPDKVRVLQHQGKSTLGIYSSRIWGAKEASCPILALLDSDDEWHPQFLSRHLAIYKTYFSERAGMLYCPVVYWWESPNTADRSYVQPIPKAGLHECPTLVLEFIEQGYEKSAANSSVVISRNILLAAANLIGTASEGVADDQFLWSFVLLQHPVFVSPEPLARYRQWSGSTCALAATSGVARDARRSHLLWLRNYLVAKYDGEKRSYLIAKLDKVLRDEYP